jgi:hypothetical protein
MIVKVETRYDMNPLKPFVTIFCSNDAQSSCSTEHQARTTWFNNNNVEDMKNVWRIQTHSGDDDGSSYGYFSQALS